MEQAAASTTPTTRIVVVRPGRCRRRGRWTTLPFLGVTTVLKTTAACVLLVLAAAAVIPASAAAAAFAVSGRRSLTLRSARDLFAAVGRSQPAAATPIPVGPRRTPSADSVVGADASSAARLFAKPRKRKRRSHANDDVDGAGGNVEDESSTYSSAAPRDDGDNDDEDDLPDFVLAEEEGSLGDAASSSSSAAAPTNKPAKTVASPAAVGDASFKEAKSVRELLGDRSLEKKMIFDDDAASTPGSTSDAEPLPDLVAMAREAASKAQSSKRQEQASRKAALQAAASSSSSDKDDEIKITDVLSKLPIKVTNDKGEITPQKVLEAGTWLGIALLVSWEIYINSPLFDRVAPMAPVVY